jgi:hypothetical protein
MTRNQKTLCTSHSDEDLVFSYGNEVSFDMRWSTAHKITLWKMKNTYNWIIVHYSMEDMGKKRNAYRLLVGKPDGKRPLGRPRRRRVGNIKMGWCGLDWFSSG